jgi:hypothetical protein
MKYIYYVDGKKFTTNDSDEINRYIISSPDENTPALENLSTGSKLWCKKGYIWHRLTGPAYIYHDKSEQFWLNDKRYVNVKKWLIDHPNQSNAFQIEMLLKYS